MKCPYCAEEIKDEAIVCRYCHRDLAAVRIQTLETKLDQQVKILEKQVEQLTQRVGALELAKTPKPSPSGRTFNASYFLSLFIVIAITSASIYFIVLYNIIALLVLPVCVFIAIGMQAGFSYYNRTIKYYLLLGFSVAFANFIGVWLPLSRIISFQSIWDTKFLDPNLSLLVTPIFLVALGAFAGEWLESKKPNGRKMEYPDNLAKQVIKFSSKEKQSDVNIEKISALMTSLAPLIAAIGGIVAPIITLLSSNKP